MLFPRHLAMLLLSMLPSCIAAHPLQVEDDAPTSLSDGAPSLSDANALVKRQTDQKLWIGYHATFLWSAAILSTASLTTPVLDMNQFYAHVSAQAEKEILAYSAQNPGKQPQGVWEFYQENLHFTAIALNDSTISFQLMSYALSRLGPLTAMGWTQHFTAIFHSTEANITMLINVATTHSIDGVVADTLLHGYNPPGVTPNPHPQIVNSHNDAGGKPDLGGRIYGSSYLSQRVTGRRI